MRLIIEARLESAHTESTSADTKIIAVVERQDRSVADFGLSLAEGRALLAEVQSVLVSQQTSGWMAGQRICSHCGSLLANKDSRTIVLRTVFGKVEVPSPRLKRCPCTAKQGELRRTVSPLCSAVRQRVTAEFEYLQAKWAAHLPYRQATELLQEVLPLDKGISLSSTRRRVLAVGKALDALLARPGYEHSTLYWNLRRLYFYIDNNIRTLVNYGARHRKGLPISSSIAESAMNQLVSHRMAKKQQMRLTDEGAHCLAQFRDAVLNGEFSVRRLASLAKRPAANSTFLREAA